MCPEDSQSASFGISARESVVLEEEYDSIALLLRSSKSRRLLSKVLRFTRARDPVCGGRAGLSLEKQALIESV